MKCAWVATALAMSLTIADSVAKRTITAALPTGSVDVVRGMLSIRLHLNPGIIGDIAVPQIVLGIASLAILLMCLVWLACAWTRRETKTVCALIVLLFGAIGNVSDRLANGYTTDYLLLFERSVMNIADMLIVVGIGWLAILMYKERGSRTNALGLTPKG